MDIVLADKSTLSVKKSVGRLLTLMTCTGLPARRFARGRLNCTYTLPGIGPSPDFEGLYDWAQSSCLLFQESTISDAIHSGFLQVSERDDKRPGDYVLTARGSVVATACVPVWEPEIALHFRDRGVPWIPMVQQWAAQDEAALRKIRAERPATAPPEKTVNELSRRCKTITRACHIDALLALWSTGDDGSCKVSIHHETDDLSFCSLEKLAFALGTRDINLSCDCGTESDHSHDKVIVARWPSLERAASIILNFGDGTT